MDKDTGPKPEGISRRTFLKLLAAGTAAALIKDLPIVVPSEEIELKNELSLDEAILDPTRVIDAVSKKILATKKPTGPQQSFLDAFSESSKNKKTKEIYRNGIIEGFKKYGEQILDLKRDILDLDIFPGRNVNWDIPGFSNLISPIATLLNQANSFGEPEMTYEQYDDLVTLTNWFNGTRKGTFEEQDKAFIKYARGEVNLKSIESKIDSSWDAIFKEHEWGYIPEWRKHKDEIKNAFINIIRTIDKHLPLGYAEFDQIILVTGGNGRDYFNELGYGQKEAVINVDEFFTGYAKMLIDSKKMPDVLPYSFGDTPPQLYFNRFLIANVHELGHGLDPLYTGRDTSRRFYIDHPDKYFSYMKEYVAMLRDWNKSIDLMGSEDIDIFFMDPLSIRDGFGIDEIDFKEGLDQFNVEMEMLKEVVSQINHPIDGPKYQKILKEIGIDNLFLDGNRDMFESWQHWLDESLRASDQLIFTKNIKSFNQISVNHLQEFQKVINDVFKNDYHSDRSYVQRVAVKTKSMYILACYKFLRELTKRGEIKNDGSNALFSIYQGFSDMVNWQACHAATGPLGQYLALAHNEPDIRKNPENQLAGIFDDAKLERAQGESKEKPILIRCFEDLYTHIVEIQKRRAALWGAKDNSVYPELAKDVINNVFKLPGLYGQPKG